MYPRSATAASTDAWASRDTRRPPLVARDAVERDTPARSATSSSVGAADGVTFDVNRLACLSSVVIADAFPQ